MQVCKSIEKVEGGYIVEIRFPFANYSDGGKRVVRTFEEVVHLLMESAGIAPSTEAPTPEASGVAGDRCGYMDTTEAAGWLVCAREEGHQGSHWDISGIHFSPIPTTPASTSPAEDASREGRECEHDWLRPWGFNNDTARWCKVCGAFRDLTSTRFPSGGPR